MRIDECQHTFEELAATVLPADMARLRLALKKPYPASMFSQTGLGPKSLAKELGIADDFSGCYVLSDKQRTIYVGISRSVLARMRQHFLGKTHYDASLAYRMAQRHRPTLGKRNSVMAIPEFQESFKLKQGYLRSLDVAFIQIENPLELYVFEAFAAMALGTSEWNTFRTH